MPKNFYYIIKDITTVESGVIVHGVNCQGVMGSGVALAIKKKWPQVYEQYREFFNWETRQYHDITRLLGQINPVIIKPDLIIINAFTQEYYGKDGKKYVSYDAIDKCFKLSIDYAYINNLPIYFPQIGAGLGGGDWRIIEQIIDSNLDGFKREAACLSLQH